MTLERKEEDFESTIGAVTVYLDDIVTLRDMLAPLQDRPVEILVDGARTIDPQDLRELDAIETLTMRAPDLGVGVAFTRNNCIVIARAGNAYARAVAAQMVLYLRQRRRRFAEWITGQRVLVVAAVFGTGPSLLNLFGADLQHTAPGLFYVLAALSVPAAAVIMTALYAGRHKVRVRPVWHRDAPSFLRRKRDDLIVNMLFLVLGLALGALIS